MRALQFKIRLEELVLKDWEKIDRLDRKFVAETARRQDLTMVYGPKYEEMVFRGKPNDLYFFLYSIAYKYDIELI